MARRSVVQITCDRTGEILFVQDGVSLDSLNDAPAKTGTALELTYRPVNGDEVRVVFEDLCPASHDQVAELVAAIKSSGYFKLQELAANEVVAAVIAPEQTETEAKPPAANDTPASPTKANSRRTYVEIETDLLEEAVEAYSLQFDKISKDPEADELDVADARETLRQAVQLSIWFRLQSDKVQKSYVRDARAARKAGGQPKVPEGLPELTEDTLKKYGLELASEDEVDSMEEGVDIIPGPTDDPPEDDEDDDDIFAGEDPDVVPDEEQDFI